MIPPLGTRATLAAWPTNGVHVAGNTNIVTSVQTTSFPVHSHGKKKKKKNTYPSMNVVRTKNCLACEAKSY